MNKNHLKIIPLMLISEMTFASPAIDDLTLIDSPDKENFPSVASTVLSGDGKFNVVNYTDNNYIVSYLYGVNDSSQPVKFNGIESQQSIVNALTFSGNMAVGTTLAKPLNFTVATVWTGDKLSEARIIGSELTQSNFSVATAVSQDGRLIGGQLGPLGNTRAIIWSGDNWREETLLPIYQLNSLPLRPTGVSAFSEDGTIAAGVSIDDSLNTFATVWDGDRWQTAHVIDQNNSVIAALSSDGSVAAGISRSSTLQQATLWHGDQWNDKTILRSVSDTPSAESAVFALSGDGRVAAGTSQGNQGQITATMWSGENWSAVTDLGAAVINSLQSSVQSLSADATVASGYALQADGSSHSVLWKIKWPEVPTVTPEEQPLPSPSNPDAAENSTTVVNNSAVAAPFIELPPQVIVVDKSVTAEAVSRLAADSLGVIQLQREGLNRLQKGCYPDMTGSCWALTSGVSKGDGSGDIATGFAVGTLLTDELSVGFNLDKSHSWKLPDSFNNSSSSLGLGGYVRLEKPNDNGSWYLMPSVAFNRYDTDINRPVLNNTESATGSTSMNGMSLSLSGGKKFNIENDHTGEWYAGLRHDEVRMKGWTEKNAEFPLEWQGNTLRRTDAFAGVKSSVSLGNSIYWDSNAEVSHSLNNDAVRVTAKNEWLGSYDYKVKTVDTLWSVSSGISYRLPQKISLSLTPSVWKSLSGSTVWGVSAGISSKF